jgi:hypothetical protein
MPRAKLLNGIAHNLAHHSQSALSYLHPHLAEASRAAGLSAVSLDLLAPDPYPPELPMLQPLRLALGALRSWFDDLVQRLGFNAGDVRSARMTFQFRSRDDYDCKVQVLVVTKTGQEIRGDVDYITA